MRLTDLLQLTNDLNNQTTFYLTIKGKILPLAKLKITADGCLLYPGQHPMSKLKIIHLVKQMHHKGIPLWIMDGKEKIPTYGIQIKDNGSWIRLT